jgi:hypothetical protein
MASTGSTGSIAAEFEIQRLETICANNRHRISELEAEVKMRRDSANYWMWQGDGEDHLDSLTCSVLIRPGDLKEIVEARDKALASFRKIMRTVVDVIPKSEHPAEPTVGNWCWQLVNMAQDRKFAYKQKESADRGVVRLAAEVGREKLKFEAHTKHVSDFLNEMYAVMVNPVEDHGMKVADLCKLLLETAKREREKAEIRGMQPRKVICGKPKESASRAEPVCTTEIM